MTVMTYAEAARLALEQEMERDPRVWALGEDLGPEGGVAGQYRGLQQKFGHERILDTPISESMIMGSAVGAAICGTRPVVELRYADFGFCAADEIINQAAKIRYMLGGQVRAPLVIRQSIGMRSGMAAQHSQNNEALWVHIPGLVVVAPGTPADSHGLLKAAIRCDDPVVFLEHKELWPTTGEVDSTAEPLPIGVANLVRPGSDATLVTWSSTLARGLEAAAELAQGGISLEVIDLRTLWPWDRDMVFASVAKTGRLVVAHESVRVGGFGAELVAEVAQTQFALLKAAPIRVASPRTPVPYSKPLEDMCRVSANMIAAAVRGTLAATLRPSGPGRPALQTGYGFTSVRTSAPKPLIAGNSQPSHQPHQRSNIMGEYFNEERNALADIRDLPVGKLAKRQVLTDDADTRVALFEFEPGDNTGWHKHEFNYCAVYLTDAKLFHTRRDGSELNTEHKAHEFKAHPVGTEHNVRNVGSAVVRLLEIEFKR